MQSKVQKLFTTVIVGMFFCFWFLVYWEQPDVFLVETKPITHTSQYSDITIKAIKNDWTIVEDYQWTIIFRFEETLEPNTVNYQLIYTNLLLKINELKHDINL